MQVWERQRGLWLIDSEVISWRKPYSRFLTVDCAISLFKGWEDDAEQSPTELRPTTLLGTGTFPHIYEYPI
jgi:hypothetical protein